MKPFIRLVESNTGQPVLIGTGAIRMVQVIDPEISSVRLASGLTVNVRGTLDEIEALVADGPTPHDRTPRPKV